MQHFFFKHTTYLAVNLWAAVNSYENFANGSFLQGLGDGYLDSSSNKHPDIWILFLHKIRIQFFLIEVQIYGFIDYYFIYFLN